MSSGLEAPESSLALKEVFNLRERTVLLTGATGFLGRTMAQALLVNGANVIALIRSDAKGGQLRDQLKEGTGRDLKCYVADFYDRAALRGTLEQAASECGRIGVLINNAYDFSVGTGFNHPSGRLETLSEDQYFHGMESGIYWAFLASQIIGKHMIERGGGSIINVGSMYSIIAPDPRLYENTSLFNPPTYSISKAAILGLTRYVASVWGRYNVRCNAILPGAFPNTSGESSNSVKDQMFLNRLTAKTVLGRVGQPSDLIGAILFLASDASSYITGQSIVIDGGWTII